MHGLITYIGLSEMLKERKNCSIQSLLAYFTIPLQNAKVMKSIMKNVSKYLLQ